MINILVSILEKIILKRILALQQFNSPIIKLTKYLLVNIILVFLEEYKRALNYLEDINK